MTPGLLALALAVADGPALAGTPGPGDTPAPDRRAATFVFGAGMGGSTQIDARLEDLILVETGFLFGSGRLRFGLLGAAEGVGAIGTHGGGRVLGLSALAGGAFRLAGAGQLDLLGEVGLQRFWLLSGQDFATSESLSGGAATRPFLGVRALFSRDVGPGDVAVGLFLHFTPDGAAVPYSVTRCAFLVPCTTEARQARYGGAALGLVLTGAIGLWPAAPAP